MKKILLPLLLVVLVIGGILVFSNVFSKPNENEELGNLNESNNNSNTIVSDIKIEEINWSVGPGTVKGENYIVMEFVNNSKYTINSFELKFTEKASVLEEEKDRFYSDIQQSQGFDDDYMTKFKESKKQLNQPITMYGKSEDSVKPSESSQKIKCYYYGGWSSKNVIHSDLLTPSIATIEYTKDNIEYTLYYNFESNSYEVEQK